MEKIVTEMQSAARSILRGGCAVILAGSLLVGCQEKPPENVSAISSDAVLGKVERLMPELSGLQFVTMKDESLDDSFALGFARLEDGTGIPLTSEHKSRIASVSKLIATIGVLQLVEEGVVDLDGDISDWFGFSIRNPAHPDVEITLRQVLSHTSSIRDGGRYWLLGQETFSDFFLSDGALFNNGAYFASGPAEAPGQFFHYANLNFGIAAGIIERASGQRFDLYMREHVLEPLGLNIGFSPCDITRNDPELLATTYRRLDADGNWDPNADWQAQVDGPKITCYVGMDPIPRDTAPSGTYLEDYEFGTNPTYFSPQGGLRASAEDLSVLMQMLMNGGRLGEVEILKPETVAEMLTPQWTFDPQAQNGMTAGEDAPGGPADGLMTAYGLSVHIVDLEAWGLSEESRLIYGHLGTAYGLLSQFWFDPETKDGLIVMMTGLGDDPAKGEWGTSPLYPLEEQALRSWTETLSAQ